MFTNYLYQKFLLKVNKSFIMNGIISTVWVLTSLLLLLLLLVKKSNATPLMDIAGEKIDKNKIPIYTGVRFQEDYDDTDYDSTLFDPSDDVHKCAQGATFCERIDNYPSTELKTILSEAASKYTELFGSDPINAISVGNRFGEDDEEQVEELCASQTRLVYPQAGLTLDNTWRYIVNTNNYTQGVRVEECMHKGQCHMMQHLPFGFRSQCKQKFIYRQLVAIDEDGITIKDLFKIPSCCQCVLIRTNRNRRF